MYIALHVGCGKMPNNPRNKAAKRVILKCRKRGIGPNEAQTATTQCCWIVPVVNVCRLMYDTCWMLRDVVCTMCDVCVDCQSKAMSKMHVERADV